MNSEKTVGNGNGHGHSAPIADLPYVVRLLLLHMLPHLDELVALWIIRKFGLTHFPGVDKAPVKFVERVPQMASDRIEKSGFLCLGLGLGADRWSIDEHRPNLKGRDRLPGQCTATLAAKRVGEDTNPALKRILDEVLWCDTESGVRYSQLAELVKLLHRFYKGNSAEVVVWLFPALEAIYSQQVLAVSAQGDETTVSEFFSEYVSKNGNSSESIDKRVVGEIKKRIADSVSNMDRSVTELAHVVRSMQRQGVDQQIVRNFCFKVFEAWQYDQVEFDEAVAIVDKAVVKHILVKSGSNEFTLKAIVVRGDSHHLLRAANWLGARFVVIQNGRGQVQVFVNTKAPDSITLDTFVGMIRVLETSPGIRKSLVWQKLKTTGAEYVANNWYYFRDARQLLNGSLTHPAVTPTTLHLDAIVGALEHAFHPRLIVKWMRQIGDPMRLFSRLSKPGQFSPSVVKGAAAGVAQDLADALDRPEEVATTA